MSDVVLTYELAGGRLRVLELDVVTFESHRATATVTDAPVEDGADVSDHVRPDLDSVSMEVAVTNHPLRAPEGTGGTVRAVDLGDGRSASVLAFDEAFDRVRDVYEELLALRDTGTVVSVLTWLREYHSMVLVEVSPRREAESGDAFVATVEARQIRIVSSEVVAAPEPAAPRDRRTAERGRQNPTEADTATAEGAEESILYRLGRSVGLID